MKNKEILGRQFKRSDSRPYDESRKLTRLDIVTVMCWMDETIIKGSISSPSCKEELIEDISHFKFLLKYKLL